MIVHSLQRMLERLHGIAPTIDMGAFLIDSTTHARMPGAEPSLPEQVFISEHNDNMDIAVFIAPHILSALEYDDPRRLLHPGNLQNFCIALEGVSHFVLLIDRARTGRPLRPLELEIQAEVDKFVHAWLLMTAQGRPAKQSARYLIRRLFQNYSLREGVAKNEIERYHLSTAIAQRYCQALARRHAHADIQHRRFQGDLRRFYRSGLSSKIAA